MAKSTKYLGKTKTESISASELDVIPWGGPTDTVITLECHEFTSHCPVTHQPDYARIVIEYEPAEHLVETKGLKLYLWSFRNEHEFNEMIVARIAREFYDVVQPRRVTVRGHFERRGGIEVRPSCTLSRSSDSSTGGES